AIAGCAGTATHDPGDDGGAHQRKRQEARADEQLRPRDAADDIGIRGGADELSPHGFERGGAHGYSPMMEKDVYQVEKSMVPPWSGLCAATSAYGNFRGD